MTDSGMADLFKNLDSLTPKVEQKLFRKALREIGDRIIQETKPLVPVGTGALRDSINKRIAIDRKKYGGITLSIGTGLFYGRFVEMGFMHTNGQHVPARPFLTPVMEANFSRIMDDLKNYLGEEVLKEMAKGGR